MSSLINDLIAQQDKKAFSSKVKTNNEKSLRESIQDLVAEENKRVPVERQVTDLAAFTVAERSLARTTTLASEARVFVAFRDVLSFLSLAIEGNASTHVTKNRDLLPIGHPLSIAPHAMTASAHAHAVARWIAADPRIDDSARALVAAAYEFPIGTVEYEHANARLTAITAGLVPQEFVINAGIRPIVAFGGNDSVSRSLRAKAQRRDRKGRFAEQGGGLQFYLRSAGGKISSIIGKFVANSDNTDGFQIEVNNHPDLPDGLYDVPASKVEALKAVLPDSAAPKNENVSLPNDVEAVDIADLTPLEHPAGWTLVTSKTDPSEPGPDKVFKTDDGYRVDWYAGGHDKKDFAKAYNAAFQMNKDGKGPDAIGNPMTIDLEGKKGLIPKAHAWDFDKPFILAYRDKGEFNAERAVSITQSWADTQNTLEKDQDKFDQTIELGKEKAAAQEKSVAESKAKQEAYIKNAEEVMKSNDQVRAEIDANLAKGLDPFGNEIPAGWEVVKNDLALNPGYSYKQGDKEYVNTPIKKEDAVSYTRTEQGYTGALHHNEDGSLVGLYQNQEFKDWNEANAGFADTVEADVNARRDAALEAIAPYDENGDIASMIENGATGQEVLDALKENKSWATALDDYETRGYVDLPQKSQKENWASFEKNLQKITNLPPEYTPIEDKEEAKAELPATKKPGALKPGDKIIVNGQTKTVKKNSSTDSGDMISFEEDKKFKIFENPDEDVQLAPADEAPEETPIAVIPEAPKPEAPAKPSDAEWILPDGAFNLYKPMEWEPEGRLDEASSDFTDDPKVLAKKFSTDDLTTALAQALRGKKSIVDDIIEELDSIVDDEENTGKPGPKKKKPKVVQNASGYGSLEFNEGDEYVPAEAIYQALDNQGVDVQEIVAELYDLGTGETKNQDMLSGAGKDETVGQQEPTALIDALDLTPEDLVALNNQVAHTSAASAITQQMSDFADNPVPNVNKGLIIKDINDIKSPNGYKSLLNDNIGFALEGNEDQKAAFRGLWGLMLSLDGGVTENGGSPTDLLVAVQDAIEKHNGSADEEDAFDIFDRFGYFDTLVASKANIANGAEDINDPNSLAGNYYQLVAELSKPNDVALYRGLRLKPGSDILDMYTTEGGIVSIDPRSFATDKVSAASFADALASHDDASVILTIDAGNGQSVDVQNISMFGDESEQIAWGDYKITSVSEKPLMGGNGTLYNVKLEKISERDAVLEGYNDNYQPLLIENQAVDLPESYYAPTPDAHVTSEGEVAPGYDDSPLTIARFWESTDLIDAFRGSIEDGTGKVLLEYPNGNEATIEAEAVRDALQIQGIDTNAILADIANTSADVPASEPDETPIESNVNSPIQQIADDINLEYDLEGWKQVGPQQGSNKGGTFEDANGDQYYVKTPKSELHAQNEVLASALYRAAGVPSAEFYIGSADDGEKKIYSPMIEGATPDLAEKMKDPEYLAKLQDGFAIDAWLANWDVAGLVMDNVVTDANGDPVRVDPGGALLFRAQGAPKGSAFGNEVSELDTLRDKSKNPQAASIFGSMTDEQQKASASKLLDVSNDDINTLVDSVVTDEAAATKLKDTLIARRQDILDRYGLLGDDTSLIAENTKVEDVAEEPATPEAPAVETPEVVPTPEAPEDNVNNPYVTSDGVPIEPGMKLKYKKTGETVDFIKYDKGNTSYVYVKQADGAIKVKSTKQLESIGGNGDGGQEVIPTPEVPSAPEAPSAPETPSEPAPEEPAAPEVAPEPEAPATPGVMDLNFDSELQPQIEKAIESKSNLSFMYNGKAREITPQSVWTNPKNGNINVYALDNADMQMKTFTISKIEPIPAGEKPAEVVAPEAPEVAVPEAGETLAPEIKAPSIPPSGEITIISSDGTLVYKQIEVTDKNGNKGTIMKVNQKDNYAFVQFEDGTTGWRSGKTITTTGNLNTGVVPNKAPKTGNATAPKTPKKKAGKITPAGAEIVIVETPDAWDESNFDNVPSLVDAIAATQGTTPGAAMRGASAAIDSDSIEDLDVRVMRVRDKDGNDGLRFKFKLTAWAGNERAKSLLALGKEEANAQGITRAPNMVIDRIDVGPDGIGQVSSDSNAYSANGGYTWTITTPDGIEVKFNRSNTTATSSTNADGRSFHNMVQIQAPANATPEQIANALSIAGVQDVRPATPADTKIWVENRLMSVFDSKVDATKNPKGEERVASLAKIKDKYGITPDDVVVTTGAAGRIETRLSPEGAQKLVDATGNPEAILHNLTIPWANGGNSDESRAEWLANLLSTPQGGLLSTTARWTEGVGGSGMSSHQDVKTGGADYVFTKPLKNADGLKYGSSGNAMLYFDPVKMYERLDFYANYSDSYGKRQSNQDVINAAKVGAYELMWKGRVSFDDMIALVVPNQAIRTAVIQKLRQKGITEIGGKPLEAAITIGSEKEKANG